MAFLNVSMPDELLQRIEAYSQRERISKSALVQKGMTDYLNAAENKQVVMDNFSAMFDVFSKKMRGDISNDEAAARLDKIENELKKIPEVLK